ncbi:glycoside hydrolase family 66 protein [Gracilibacillus sp. YIM 98692]|uniref:glycoside hydrolase family 66 protein n=1 Tax=Gracilibacillus sp. YIM 98692 TaxID=2663532 RepID=UPI0013D2568A|nr:glycoside hydrolase family 66 protein [Gracilibacillus sp. YIM 98692]
MWKKEIFLSFYVLGSLLIFSIGCTPNEPNESDGKVSLLEITKDKAAYSPGEAVTFRLTLNKEVIGQNIFVRYKHLNDVIQEEKIELTGDQEITWEWQPPNKDFQGYMVEIVLTDGEEITNQLNMGVDVSSDWSKFPRYGYLANFQTINEQEQQRIIEKLNRFHINGIQFYDWQDRHDHPLKMENGEVASTWQDIANREVSKQTIENYIEMAHEKNMKAMNYNLLFGANENYEVKGVSREWGIFKDPNQNEQDKHPLPEEWKSNIYLFDPSNLKWQRFLFEKEQEVFNQLNFDGWHVDQLGHRGDVWNKDGEKVDLWETYPTFLKKAKDKLDVDLVMNAVSQYGQAEIAQSPVNFLYTETWEHPYYQDLKQIVDENKRLSDGRLQTVLAAYMNYDLADSPGEFNTPGVLFTDAVIFASGGAHIELGENLLAKEYFPNKNLNISKELNEQLISYYDFSVAYQNLLRDESVEIDKEVLSKENLSITKHPEIGSIWNFNKKVDNKEILHFINFTNATSLEWRDQMGEQTEPRWLEDISITVDTDKRVDKIWVASPDIDHGSAIPLDFEQLDNRVTFRLPSLKYWDMVVLEYKS